ncbi:tetratricopeptide repeat protein [Rheinheimera mangrovi]|uniref:tetratricopeptide repeat protein n=1 Tax=Rheinheimera mangrovi TaxID=2498451 RepID=UPI001E3A6269|nr:tetratricopeptide repeat protein [Rheinheimera mangrovi]
MYSLMCKVKFLVLSYFLLLCCLGVQAREVTVVQLYTQDELLELIKQNIHLQRVQKDECQLVSDIQARADVMKVPAYQFLYGDMLAFGVCVKKDVERGWDLMLQAASQGLPEALEQVGRYYHIGRFVQQDNSKAVIYLREAAGLGNLKAQMRFAQMLIKGDASPLDMEDCYRWLHHSVIADTKTHQEVQQLLAQLATKMPGAVLTRAKRPL